LTCLRLTADAGGAIEFAAGPDSDLASRAVLVLCAACGTTAACSYNDNHTHAELLASFDRAILALSY
jgi:hypothetical protein